VARPLIQWWRVALVESGVSPSALAVGLAMSASEAHAGYRTAIRALGELERAGLLVVDRSAGGRHLTNGYQAIAPNVNGAAMTLFAKPKRCKSRTVSEAETVPNLSGNGATAAPRPRKFLEDLSGAPGRPSAPAPAREAPARFVADEVLIAEANERAADHIRALAKASEDRKSEAKGAEDS